jgi:16S rRNA (adenine1518-N6/adenine1519-N6)-dimethyltransferase
MIKRPSDNKNYPQDQELTEILSLLKRNRLRPKKRLGQTFLFKKYIAEEIVRLADITRQDIVVEIGAGLGVLTRPLAERAESVIALEYDTALVSLLQKIIANKNVEIIRADALHYGYEKLFAQHKRKLKIIGNLPYYITSPLLFKLLELKSIIDEVTIMMQKEVADRVVSQPKKKEYGTISIFSQLHFDISKQLTVVKDCFYPEPKVDSEVVKFTARSIPLAEVKNERLFEKVIRTTFSNRRKTLLNSIKGANYFNLDKNKILIAFEHSGIDPQRRPETLTISEFSTLCNNIGSV